MRNEYALTSYQIRHGAFIPSARIQRTTVDGAGAQEAKAISIW